MTGFLAPRTAGQGEEQMLKDQQARRSPDGETPGARRPYETPVLEELGVLEQLTQGTTPGSVPDNTEFDSV